MKLQNWKQFRKTVILVVIFTFAFFVGYTFGSNGSGSTFTISSGIYPGAVTYTIYREGNTYYAKNAYGVIDFKGTDATAVIQAAINALPNLNGKIFIKAGVYEVNGIYIECPITVTEETQQHLILEGEGKFTTIIKLKNNADGAKSKDPNFTERAVILAEPKGGTDASGIRVTIRNLYIHGNRKNQVQNIAGIIVRGPRQAIIEDCFVYYCSKFGISFRGPYIIRENHIRRNTVYEIWNYDESTPPSPVEENLVAIYSSIPDVTIEDNIVGGTGSGESRGVGIRFGETNTIIRNWLWGHRFAIFGVNVKDSQISDNLIENNRETGIRLVDCENILVSNNRIRMGTDNVDASHGIRLYGSCRRIVVRGNMIWARNGYELAYGIREGETPSDNLIEGNAILKGPGFVYTAISFVNATVRNNFGFVTENSGTATIPAGSTYVIVTHGLDITPDINRIKITPKDDLRGLSFWVGDVTSTTFRIYINAADTVNHSFGWSYG